MVISAVKKLADADALLLGTVINDRHNPSLKDELLREIRCMRRFSRFGDWAARNIQGTRLLSDSAILTPWSTVAGASA